MGDELKEPMITNDQLEARGYKKWNAPQANQIDEAESKCETFFKAMGCEYYELHVI